MLWMPLPEWKRTLRRGATFVASRGTRAAPTALLVWLTAAAFMPPAATGTSASDLKSAARQAFEQGDLPKARERLTALLQLYRQAHHGDPYAWRDRLAEVAREYLRAGELSDALHVVGEAADLNLPRTEDRGLGLASAAGGLHRRLTTLDATEQFELLHQWSMPSATRSAVRVLTTITPIDRPPAVFARALGERPRDDSFAIPAIGEVSGLFCSAWELVSAAREVGMLRRLTYELTQLADDDVPNARFVLILARVAASRRADQQLLDDILDGENDGLVMGAVCLTQEWLQPIGERILKAARDETYGPASVVRRPFLRYAHATAIRKRQQRASSDVLRSPDLQWWVAASMKQAWPTPQASVRPMWLAHQDHILHSTGPRSDFLFFKYPLVGQFEFSCDAQIGGPGGTDGCVAYGGLSYEVRARRQRAVVCDDNLNQITEFHCPFVHNHPLATFNRFSLASTAGGVTFSANGHKTWLDATQDSTSPWIGLRAFGARAPIFRNFRIGGAPTIPREVKMSGGNSLRGWISNYYGEQTPATAPPGSGLQPQSGLRRILMRMTAHYDWSSSGGVIRGAKRAAVTDDVAQSRLYYLRPLQNGESISYEFRYQPDELEVHPTLGRIAFLIEPGGVRLHWMTAGEQEWTGLAEDNAVVEPLNRRGPKPLPLQSGEWNRVTVEMKRDTVTLALNDTHIYTRKIEAKNERTFGFYHDKRRSAVRVRNVVMRGDWPEQLTEKQLDNLAAASNSGRSDADKHVLGRIFDDRHVPGSAFAVSRRARQLPPESRYDFLAGWVLPNAEHETLRLALDFTPTNPAPPVGEQPLAPSSGHSRVGVGGDLVSPALDLIAVAKELGKLDELRERIAASTFASDDQQRRSQLAMLALIDIAADHLPEAKGSLDKLASMVTSSNSSSFSERWPETLAIWEAAQFSETRDAARDMALHIVVDQVRKHRTSGSTVWDQQMRSLISRVSFFDLLDREPALRDASAEQPGGPWPLTNWVPASPQTTRTRGLGFPQARWAMPAPATVENFASHHDDFLFYRIPLRGDFEVECDVSAFGYRETTLWVAGRWVGPVYTLRHVDVGTFRNSQRLALEPPLHRPDAWIRYRAVVRNGVCTTYANGRKIHERSLAPEHDPWLAIRSYDTTNGAVRHLRVTGNPEIPDEVRITCNADLPGWLPLNEGHRVGSGRKWRQLGDLANGGGIRGIRWQDLPGSHRETLLRYHRPMVEDGTIKYDFYYRAGEFNVHPALDRLAFMLQPDGVRVHWITDGKFDRTGLAPDNLYDEPEHRRGPEMLPLKANTWNRMQLSLSGDTVELKLNEELIYQRELERTNQRTFGLFHYADATEALARNVVWRGDWPRELPPIKEQELAGDGMEFLDESLEGLAAVFHHDFVEHGLARNRFGLNGRLKDFDARPEGLQVSRRGGEGYQNSALSPQLRIHGDFDIIAEFTQFEAQPSAGGSGGVYLQAILDNDKSNECLIYRRYLRHRKVPQPIIQGSFVTREVGGARRSNFKTHVAEAPAGRLRLARRGDIVYHLFAENDSPHFRLFGTSTAPRDDVRLVKLMTQTHLEGMTKVVWKNLTIRANDLSGLALQDHDKVLADLNKQRDALSDRFVHDFSKERLGSARFQVWGPVQPVAGDDGVRMISIGTDRWTSSGFNSLLGLHGDFDAEIKFDDLDLAKPKEKLNSAFYLQVEFPDAGRTQANVILVDRANVDRQLYAQLAVTDAGGNKQYRRLRTAPVGDLTKFRLVRRGKRVSFLYRVKGADTDEILAQTDISDLPILPGNLRWLLHTGGDGRQSQVFLKKVDVRGAKIAPNPPKATQSPTLLRSLIDLFK